MKERCTRSNGRNHSTALVSVLVFLLFSRGASAWFSASPPSTPSTTRLLAQHVDNRRSSVQYYDASVVGRTNTNGDDDVLKTGTASIPNLTTSLVKSIVGGGVLALPAAVAAMGGDNPETVLPTACLMIAAAATVHAYFFQLLGKVCSWTGATSYTEAWERTVGPESSPVVAAAVTLKTALGCLAYSMILADSFQSLAMTAGLVDITRTEALSAVTVTALLPLCMLRNLQSLAPYSLAGILGFGCTAGAMAYRHLDGTYDVPAASVDGDGAVAPVQVGHFLHDLPATLQPAFGQAGPDWHAIGLVCTLATAFVCHYNSPRFHAELENNTDERFGQVTWQSFAIAAGLFMVIATQGFATFGTAAQALVLNNYSPYDPLLTACRAAVAASLVVTYPLPFVGLRDGIFDLLQVPVDERSDSAVQTVTTIGLLAAVTIAAALIQDLGLLLAVGGGTFSTAVASVFPTLMFQAAVENNLAQAVTIGEKSWNELEAKFSQLLMFLSMAIGATGVSLALQNFFHAA
jgi:amino acid permease